MSRPVLWLSLLSVSLFHYSIAANILFCTEFISGSHVGSMTPFAAALAAQGHNVTFLEADVKPTGRKFPNGIENFYLHLDFKKFEGVGFWWRNVLHGYMTNGCWTGLDVVMEYALDHYEKRLESLINRKWDLVVVDETFNNMGYALADRIQQDQSTPYIVFTTTVMFYADSIQNAYGWSPVSRQSLFITAPDEGDSQYDPTQFGQRLRNAYENIMEYIMVNKYTEYISFSSIPRVTGRPYSWARYFDNAAAVLTDSIDVFGHPIPKSVEQVNMGQYCSKIVSNQLPAEFEQFVSDESSQGTIYVALGSQASWQPAPYHVKEAFHQALDEMKEYRIIFAGNLGDSYTFSSHVKVVKWAPQPAILNHPKTKMFITHGGLKSVKEAICSRTPMLTIPVWAEQGHNARVVYGRGMSEFVNKFTVTKEEVIRKTRQIMTNPSYQSSVDHNLDLYMDNVVDKMQLAVSQAERVIKHGSRAGGYRRVGRRQTWVEYLYGVEIAIVAAVVITMVQ